MQKQIKLMIYKKWKTVPLITNKGEIYLLLNLLKKYNLKFLGKYDKWKKKFFQSSEQFKILRRVW